MKGEGSNPLLAIGRSNDSKLQLLPEPERVDGPPQAFNRLACEKNPTDSCILFV